MYAHDKPQLFQGIASIHGTYLGGTHSIGLSQGTIDGSNPGTRETIVTYHNLLVRQPMVAAGVWLQLAGLTINTDVKVRCALANSDGNVWKGSAGVNTALPLDLLASDTAGAALSAMRTAAISSSGRALYKAFTTPVEIMAGKYWICIMSECQYGADSANTSSFEGWTDPVSIHPHEIGGNGNSRNLAWKTLQTTAIDSLAWSTFVGSGVSNVAANLVSATASAIAPTGRTFTGALGAWGWGLKSVQD